MKRTLKIAAVALFIMLGSSWRSDLVAQPYPPDQYNDDGDVTYQEFYDELSPHGRWIDHPQHGYVWVPDAGPDFKPYSTDGHWVWTENYEWMWVSDFDWGWAPFHYGRWDYDPYYSWYWVPGYEWSPAWVAWRDGGDYYGWAPIRPGISISINFNIGGYSPPYDFWCFTPRRYILYDNVYSHCIDRRQNITIINQTTIINNYSYNRNVFVTGPRRSNFEVYTGRITPYRINTMSRPGRSVVRNNQVSVFRPNVRRDNNRQFAPRNVERYDRQGGNNSGRFDRGSNNRSGSNDGRFDRGNNNNDRRGANVNTPRNGNNLPGNVERRNDQPVRQPNQRGQNETTGRPSREMDQRAGQQPRQQRGGNEVIGRPSREMNPQRQTEQPRQQPGNEVTGRPSREMNQGPWQQPRQQRGNEMNGNGRPSREMSPQRQPEQPRQMERREVQGRPSREMSPQRQPEQPRQMERREAQGRPSREMQPQRQQPSREVSQPRQQQAPQQMERRESSSRESNGRGNGRGRN